MGWMGWTWALVGLDMDSVGSRTEESRFFWCFFWMALGEEFRFEFQRSMPMRASKFECTYSSLEHFAVEFKLRSCGAPRHSQAMVHWKRNHFMKLMFFQFRQRLTSDSHGFASQTGQFQSTWQHHFQDSRGFVCFQSRKSRQFRNAICWRGDSSML